jgi:hypothetical protein
MLQRKGLDEKKIKDEAETYRKGMCLKKITGKGCV